MDNFKQLFKSKVFVICVLNSCKHTVNVYTYVLYKKMRIIVLFQIFNAHLSLHAAENDDVDSEL